MENIFSLITSRLFWLWLILVGGLWRYFGDTSSESSLTSSTIPIVSTLSWVSRTEPTLDTDEQSTSSTLSDDSLFSLLDDVGSTRILEMLRSASDKEQTLDTYIQQIDALVIQGNNRLDALQSSITSSQSAQSVCTNEQTIALGHLTKATDPDATKTLLEQAQAWAWCSAAAHVAITYHTQQSSLLTRRVEALVAKKNLIMTNRDLLITYTSELSWPIPAQLLAIQKVLTTQ